MHSTPQTLFAEGLTHAKTRPAECQNVSCRDQTPDEPLRLRLDTPIVASAALRLVAKGGQRQLTQATPRPCCARSVDQRRFERARLPPERARRRGARCLGIRASSKGWRRF